MKLNQTHVSYERRAKKVKSLGADGRRKKDEISMPKESLIPGSFRRCIDFEKKKYIYIIKFVTQKEEKCWAAHAAIVWELEKSLSL
jgi:hypothetical protein